MQSKPTERNPSTFWSSRAQAGRVRAYSDRGSLDTKSKMSIIILGGKPTPSTFQQDGNKKLGSKPAKETRTQSSTNHSTVIFHREDLSHNELNSTAYAMGGQLQTEITQPLMQREDKYKQGSLDRLCCGRTELQDDLQTLKAAKPSSSTCAVRIIKRDANNNSYHLALQINHYRRWMRIWRYKPI